MTKIKSAGDKTEPCLTPRFIGNVLEQKLEILTQDVLFEYQLSIRRARSCLQPLLCIDDRKVLGTQHYQMQMQGSKNMNKPNLLL